MEIITTSNKKEAIRVFIKVNHSDKTIYSRIASYPFGYMDEPNGKWLKGIVYLRPDQPVEIPIAGVKVSSRFVAQEETKILNRRSPDYQNKFKVTVKKDNSEITFEFTGSINDAGKGIVNLSNDDLINAFYCFIGDAISGTLTCKEFKDEYGYSDCCEAHRVHKLCKESTVKAVRLGIGDLYDLTNKLQEKYPDVL